MNPKHGVVKLRIIERIADDQFTKPTINMFYDLLRFKNNKGHQNLWSK
jgi:hypothetical protein